MKELLKKYEEKQPEIVFNWKDPETEAGFREATTTTEIQEDLATSRGCSGERTES